MRKQSGRFSMQVLRALTIVPGIAVLLLLAGCALTDPAPGSAPDRTPLTTATPKIPTATATLELQPAASPTRVPVSTISASAATPTQASTLPGRTALEKPVGELVLSDVILKTFHVSTDRRHYAYVTRTLAGWTVVWDGRQGKVYSEISTVTLRMSVDGLHIAYVAHGANQWVIVKDEQEVYAAEFEMLLGLSRDGSRLAHSQGSEHATMLIDDKPGHSYNYVTSPVFSPDGRHVAYVGTNVDPAGNENSRMVRDGVEGKIYDYIDYGDVVFSPDSKRLAYPATIGDRSNGKAFVVVDEQEKRAYDFIGLQSIRFSPDGSRLAYVAELNGLWLVVADEKEGRQWENFCTCISFSPDSKHLAYQGISRSASFAVIDDNAGDSYLRILSETPIFSPDSRHSAFMGLAKDGWLLAIDSKEFGKDRYDGAYPGMLAFSPDSGHIAYAALKGIDSAVYVDGHAGNVYSAILASPVFDAPQHLAYLALRDGKVIYVEEKLSSTSAQPAVYATAAPGTKVPDYYILSFDLNFNTSGSGPLTIAGGKNPYYHYRPTADPKAIQSVKSLTLHVVFAQSSGSPAPTLMFNLFANGGGWGINGGHNQFNWGVNDIELQNPDDYVSRKGDITIQFLNVGKQNIEVESINFTLITANVDGSESTYKPQ
jgi:hypothetical protein